MRRAALWIAVAIGFSIPISTALDNLLVAALLLCWVASGEYREKLATIRDNPFALAAVGFFLLHAAGAAYSIGSREEILQALDKAAPLLLVPILVSLRPGLEWLSRAVLAFLAALSLTLLLSFPLWLGLMPQLGFVKGLPYDPVVFKLKITHSVLMAYGAFVLAIAAQEAVSRGWRIALGLGAGLAAFNVLFMVWGRTGQLVVLALFLYFVLSWYRWWGLLAAVVASLAIGGAVILTPSSSLHQRTLTTIQEFQDWRAGKPVTPANTRLETWSNSVEIVRANPVLGVGTGGFAAAYARQVEGTRMTPVGHAENQYLYTAVQLGYVGLGALVALFAFQWWWAARLQTPTETVLARGLVILMAIGCLFNPFLHDHSEALFYAWLSGLLFAGLRPAASRG